MKQLIRRLSRVANSSSLYTLLRSDSQFGRRPHRSESCRSAPSAKLRRSRARTAAVPEGHALIYVSDKMERFVVSAELLNHPIFVNLLNKSTQEYGYEQKGVLRIPCHVIVFERVLEALRLSLDLDDNDNLLINSSSSEEFC